MTNLVDFLIFPLELPQGCEHRGDIRAQNQEFCRCASLVLEQARIMTPRYVCIYICVYVYIHIYIYMCICIHIYMCVCVCVCACGCVFVCIVDVIFV